MRGGDAVVPLVSDSRDNGLPRDVDDVSSERDHRDAASVLWYE